MSKTRKRVPANERTDDANGLSQCVPRFLRLSTWAAGFEPVSSMKSTISGHPVAREPRGELS